MKLRRLDLVVITLVATVIGLVSAEFVVALLS